MTNETMIGTGFFVAGVLIGILLIDWWRDRRG